MVVESRAACKLSFRFELLRIDSIVYSKCTSINPQSLGQPEESENMLACLQTATKTIIRNKQKIVIVRGFIARVSAVYRATR